ncbi:MAG: site-specific integrase [Methanomassiliicoccales archaeon]
MSCKDDALTDQELDILISACNINDPREKVIILLAGDLGLREGEIAALQSTWINFQRGHIIIPSKSEQGWTPKRADSARTIPALKISSRAWEAARDFFTAHPSLDMTRMTVYRIVVRVAERSGLKKKVYPHCLRATAATKLAYRVHNPIVLCDIFGWKQLKMAEVYIRRAGGRTEAELERPL